MNKWSGDLLPATCAFAFWIFTVVVAWLVVT